MNTPSSNAVLPGVAPVHALPAALPVPWWRVGVMWFALGGLGLVVIGSFGLLAAALDHPDAVEAHGSAPAAVPNTPTSPAMQARNHVATPAR
ncbi:MAG: hypothetical protein KGL99_12660 [Burkholderiales bacterium]|nr:hypothetical protein [Burkholderiales bacterium]MDE2627996.1 hypothetical protein [Burkholderiales bacterium]